MKAYGFQVAKSRIGYLHIREVLRIGIEIRKSGKGRENLVSCQPKFKDMARGRGLKS